MKDKINIAIVVAIFITQYFYSLFIANLMPSAEVNLVVNILVSLLVIGSVRTANIRSRTQSVVCENIGKILLDERW